MDKLDSLGPVGPTNSHVELPLATEGIEAGFPAPNGGHIDGKLDVNEFLVTSPSSTYIYRVHGESMRDAGIMPGDYVLVDSSRAPRDGDAVVARIDSEYTIKELKLYPKPQLVPRNPDFEPIDIYENSDVVIIGPVISVIRKYH
ncbi:MAG: LexA family protein [Succinivibrio sp.]